MLLGDGDGLSEDAAKQRGSDIHLLLEHLPAHPQTEWSDIAAMLLPDAAPDILAEVTALLTNPDLAFLFDDSTLAEVPITANLPDLGGKRIYGEIDRLVVSPEKILAVDFKSNAIVPENPDGIPDGLLRQMGAYQAALGMVYPDHKIETAILWTRTGVLMYLEHKAVTAALRATTIP